MKVAGCVALFSLDKVTVVPVDTHVWDIVRRFSPELKERKTITPAVHRRVGELFREEFGEEAGWAHCILFAGELSAFKKEIEGGAGGSTSDKSKKTKKHFKSAKSEPRSNREDPPTKKKSHPKGKEDEHVHLQKRKRRAGKDGARSKKRMIQEP